jgi:formylglycine-generating enzyme required for sulfatase activity
MTKRPSGTTPSQQREQSWVCVAIFIATHLWAAAFSSPVYAAGKYALVIGVEKYIPDQLSTLNYAEDDAVALGEALGKLGFAVITMTSKNDNPLLRPSDAISITRQITQRLSDRKETDTVVLALSGHGVEFGDEKNESWFCPEKADLSDRNTLVRMSSVLEAIGACGAGKKLLLVDACRDKFLPKSGSKGVNVVDTGSSGPPRLEPSAGTLALFACRSGERSFELSDRGHGVFTSHVLDYLNGKANAELYENGQATVKGLDAFVSSSTRELVEQVFAKSQRPVSLQPSRELDNWALGSVPRAPQLGNTLENSIGIKFIAIPGPLAPKQTPANTEEPHTRREPDPRPVYIGTTEVTQQQWQAVMASNASYFSEMGRGNKKVAGMATDNLPVENVTWSQANEFCERMTTREKRSGEIPPGYVYRLPSAAEWQAACLDEPLATWNIETANGRTQPIASLPPNSLGVYDMMGNVWEWCSDQQPDDDTNALLSMARGGSWLNVPSDCSPRAETNWSNDFRSNLIGLRIALAPNNNLLD